jgi:hypothetical protein
MNTEPVAELAEFCEFDENRVYLFLVIARTKENPQLSSGSEITFREVVEDRADLGRTYDRLRRTTAGYQSDADDSLTFRLYVTVNSRNAIDAYFNFRERMDGWIRDRLEGDEAAPRKFKRLDSYWKSELQKPAARDDARLLFDLDEATAGEKSQLVSTLADTTEVVTRRETPNGYHVVTEPFNYNELDADVDYELKTDGLLFVEILTDEETRE